MENEVNWSERRKGGGGVLNEGQSLKTFSAQLVFFFPPMLYLPQRKSLIPSTLICCDGWFELRHFLVVLFLCLTDYSSVQTVIK